MVECQASDPSYQLTSDLGAGSCMLGDYCSFSCDAELQILVTPTEYSQISLKTLLIRSSKHEFIWIHFESIYNFPWHPQHNLLHMFTACVVNNISFYLSPRQPPSNFKDSLSFYLVFVTALGFPLASSFCCLIASVPRQQSPPPAPWWKRPPSMPFSGLFVKCSSWYLWARLATAF